VFALGFDPDHETLADYPAERFAELIRDAAGVADLQPDIERIAPISYVAGLADRFRAGDVFLIGDAAHRVSPRGATGMNTAIRDGHDIGWKLGWVLHGWAGPALLDSYEAERRPVAAHNVARSADPNGSVRAADEGLQVDLGGRIRHAWVADGVSTLDLVGPGLTLFTGPDAPVAGLPGSPPVAVRRLDAIIARGLGIRPGTGLLVRPDGVPVALDHVAAEPDRALSRASNG
jgi:2-polyprenyl-6-methoxyphenol hydroxylase-like FAD-dependent oxidoreductase